MVSKNKILKAIPNILKTVNIPNLGEKHQGKVRDYYVLADEQSSRLRTKRIIITTDRQSAFDRVLGHIPYKGAVLNLLSAFWFDKTKDIIDNHWVCNLYYNVIVVKNCQIIPIEMVVRGYITGVTDTSIWGSYEKGERVIYGIKFPDGLKKNQKLPSPVITPTTKAESGHDERLTEKEILEKKIVSIILADTKYEFGLFNGKLMLIDEVHTPDSSRFWVKKSYKDRLKKGLEPESYDKEILRIWFKEKGYSGEGKPPKMPDDFLVKMSQRYIGIYEKITGKKFKTFDYPIEKRIRDSLKKIG